MYILRSKNGKYQPIQANDLPTYDNTFKGWRFNDQLLIDVEQEFEIEEGSLPPPPPPPPPPWLWIIDTPAFFARFGAAEDDVLSETQKKKTVARVAKFSRKWYIDLKDPKTATMLDDIAADIVSLTPAIKTAILTTPVAPEENTIARRVFFV